MDSGSRVAIPLLLGLFTCCAIEGCGYRLGYRAPNRVRSIAVPIFNNSTLPLRRDIEYELTATLRQDVQSRTSLRLVADETADMVVYGTVSGFDERVLAEDRQDAKLEAVIEITVDLVVEDRVNGKKWIRTVRDREPFSLARGETSDLARLRAVDNLSEMILIALDAW